MMKCRRRAGGKLGPLGMFLLPVFFTLASDCIILGQGVVDFNNRVPGVIDARVTFVDGTGVGAGFIAQLFGGPAGTPSMNLQPLLPTTTFRTSSPAAMGYINQVDVIVPGVAPGSRATLEMRVYNGSSFESSPMRTSSPAVTITVGGGVLAPAYLVGLTGFTFLSKPATPQAASVDGFDYPFGPPDGTPRCSGTAQCANGWRNVQDFRVNNHLGEDWNFGFGEDDLGKPVYAVANGVVSYAQDVGGDGSWKGVIIIRHSGSNIKVPGGSAVSEVTSLYGHLDVSKITAWVSVGSVVSRGQQIGVIGPTPTGSTGPHLHFEIRSDTSIGVGPGYSANSTGWIDPSDFIAANRPATSITNPVFVSESYTFTTLAGLAGTAGSADGTGSVARFNGLTSVAVDSFGNVVVADYYNHAIRKITPSGLVSTLAGNPAITDWLWGTPVGGYADGAGSSARFRNPWGVTVDKEGNIYVTDSQNNIIRKIDPSGLASTLAGVAASFYNPTGIAVDSAGVLYVSDTGNHTIRKITASGIVSTFAGSAGLAGRTDGAGAAARFNSPFGIAVDSAGNLYVADTDNHTIRKITADGTVSTFAGTAGSAGRVDGLAVAARFTNPRGVAVDRSGNVYVGDTENHAIRKITPGGDVSTLAGSLGILGSADGSGGAARFNKPRGLAMDTMGNLYVADTGNQTVRKGSPTSAPPNDAFADRSVITGLSNTASGSNVDATKELNEPIHSGSQAGKSVWWTWTAPIFGPVTIDTIGSTFDTFLAVYTGDSISALTLVASDNDSGGNRTSRVSFDSLAGRTYQIVVDGYASAIGRVILNVRQTSAIPPQITAQPLSQAVGLGGNVTFRVEATGTAPLTYQWRKDGVNILDATNATFTIVNLETNKVGAYSVLVSNAAGSMASSDAELTVTTEYTFTTLAGQAGVTGSQDGKGTTTRYNNPMGVAVDDAGNLYVADNYNHTVRKITPSGNASTLAGLAGSSGTADGAGNTARFNGPWGVAVNRNGAVYVADNENNTIRKMTRDGVVSTLAGSPAGSGSADGVGSAARFNNPRGVAVDVEGNVYVADSGNHTIRKITPLGSVSTLAGTAGTWGSSDGAGRAARFLNPSSVAVDKEGFVYVADDNHTVRKITPSGIVSTLAGSAGVKGSSDGTGSAARFTNPTGLTVDSHGNLFVADWDNHTIRAITRSGVVTTLAGSARTSGSSDGTGSAARFYHPLFVAVDNANNVYVGDTWNHTIRKGWPVAAPPNDAFVARLPMAGLTNGVVGFNLNAAKEPGEPNHAGNSGGRSVWWTWTAPADGKVTVDTVGSYFDTLLAIYMGNSVSDLAQVASDNDSGGNRMSKVTFSAVAGATYQIVVDGNNGASGSIILGLQTEAKPANDDLGNALVLTGITNTVVGVNGAASKEQSEPDHAGNPGGKSVWWSWIPPANVTVTVDTIGSSFDTLLAVYTGSSVSDLKLVTSDNDGGGNRTSKVSFSGMVSATYQIAVDGWNGTSGNIVLNFRQSAPAAPQIITQPQSATVSAGDSVSFSITATGTPPLTYRWLRDGQPLNGGTNSVYTIGNAQTNHAGAYSVAVSNAGGSVISSNALLSLQPPGTVTVAQWPGHQRGDAQAVVVIGKLAYLALGFSGIGIIDVSNAVQPVWLGGYADRNAQAVEVVGNFAYVASGFAGLQIIDVSNPVHPVEVSAYNTGGSAYDLVLSGDYAYVAAGAGSLQIIDISNPSKPVRISSLSGSISDARRVTIVGDVAYVAGADGGLHYIDVRNPARPFWFGGTDTRQSINGMAEGNGYVWVASDGGLLRSGFPTDINGIYYDVAVSGNFAYVAAGSTGVQVFDISNPLAPKRVGTVDTSGSAYGVTLSGNYAYVADGEAGLQVVDVSDASSLRRVGGFETSGSAYGVAVSGNYAYLADGSAGVRVIEVSNRVEPKRVGGFSSSGWAYGVAIAGRYAYVADGYYGLQVMDLSDSFAARRVGGFDTSGYAYGVAVSGNYAYVADGDAGLVVIEINNPSAAKRVGSFNTSGSARGVAVSGNLAYVADEAAGVQVIEVSDPASPRRIGGFVTKGYANGVALSGDYLYVANGSSGVEVIDVSDLASPRRVGGFDTSGYAYGVAVSSNYVYVADGSWGLVIQPPMPPSIVTQPTNRTAVNGSTATLTVSAESIQQLRYQWRRDGASLIGKTNETLTLTGVNTNDAGYYSVVVSNDFGAVTSSNAWLTVIVPPENATVLKRGNGTLSVTVKSSNPVFYQWRKDGVSISGATNASFSVNGAQTNQGGTYTVVVSEQNGPTNTFSATLSVVAALRRAPTTYWPGVPVVVEIETSPTQGTISHTVTERLPRDLIPILKPAFYNADGTAVGYRKEFDVTGFFALSVRLEASNINEGGLFDSTSGTLKWPLFRDDTPRVLRYTLVPPLGSDGQITLDGTFTEDGRTVSLPEGRLRISPHHPADNSPATDNFIKIFELSGYALTRYRSLLWPVPPNPIGDDYLTQAALIWKRGEYYQIIDGTPPFNWQPAPLPAGIRKSAAAGSSSERPTKMSVGSAAASGTAARSVVTAKVNPAGPFDVTITVIPQASVSVIVLEEQLPTGWTASNISAGGLMDMNFNKVKWGPVFNSSSAARTFTYRAIPAAGAGGTFTLSGLVAFDATVVKIGGQSEISLGSTEAPGPQLRAEWSGSNIVLSWEKNATAFVLEVSDSLTKPSWTRVLDTPAIIGANLSITVQVVNGSKFYRLRGQ